MYTPQTMKYTCHGYTRQGLRITYTLPATSAQHAAALAHGLAYLQHGASLPLGWAVALVPSTHPQRRTYSPSPGLVHGGQGVGTATPAQSA
jgi:hypothetical protein